jgi:hypothetical protein
MGQQEPEVEVHAVAQKVTAPPGSAAVTYGVAAPPGSSVAIPAGNDTSSVPMWQQEKQGAKCCGCCCDYRRAVIVVEIISIVFAVINVITIVTVSSIGATGAINDDEVEDVFKGTIAVSAALTGIALLTSVCGLYGALKFNIWLVAVDVVWMAGTYTVEHLLPLAGMLSSDHSHILLLLLQ